MRVLFAASECWPLIKTGGLADVAYALPLALTRLGAELRVALPAYRGLIEKLETPQEIRRLNIRGQVFRVVEGGLAGTPLRFWLLDAPYLYQRDGGPYVDAHGHDYPDNAWRFGCFSEALHGLALGAGGWQPEVLHANDWQTGLALAWLSTEAQRPRTVFTIHNLAYQGHFGREVFDSLGLPRQLWSIDGVELYGGLNCMKAGIVGADVITTVSPTYAREIQTPDFGCGLQDVLRYRAHRLSGIANGIDTEAWDPSNDPHLVQRYSLANVWQGKNANKRALQEELSLRVDADAPLIGVISRLAYQKGTDLILGALEILLHEAPDLQFAFLASGDRLGERALAEAAARHPRRVAVNLAYDERLAHRIEAGADLFLMPSRFEPCGLNQMYSQRYGTVPVVRRTGGLADTVTDASDEALARGEATGVHFEHADIGGVLYGVRRALQLRGDAASWKSLQRAGMARDFSWQRAAQAYLDLYRA